MCQHIKISEETSWSRRRSGKELRIEGREEREEKDKKEKEKNEKKEGVSR